jgi:PAS domain S-box-containing protein
MRSALNSLLARLLIGSAIPLVLFVAVGLVAVVSDQNIALIGTTAATALALTLVLAVVSARSVTQPVRRLREAADRLLAGRYRSIAPDGPRELAELIVRFNHLALTLSERVRVLRAQEERYRTYVGASSHIVWTTNAEGDVAGDLPAWRAFTGQGEEEVRGKGWLDAVHPDERPAVEAAWREAVAGRGVFEVECRLRSKAGEYRPFACRGVPIVTEGGAVREWIGTCTDLTDSKQRAALRQAMEAAEAASLAKSEFLAKMSHELRTPLNAVIGMSKMLLTERFGPLKPKQADYLTDITRAGEHLLALINDILDLSKVEAGKMEVQADSFQAADAVGTLVSTLRPLAEAKKVRLRADEGAGDGTLSTDPGRFRQVLYNLVSNAIKYTPGPGSVTVAWEWAEAPTREARVVPEAVAVAVRVAVRDTGVGIAPQDQDAIWDEFRQLRSPSEADQQGTGLGLALTRRLVRLLGGSLCLESAVGQGSTFTFVVPRRLPRPAAAACDAGAEGQGAACTDQGPHSRAVCQGAADAEEVAAAAGDAGPGGGE